MRTCRNRQPFWSCAASIRLPTTSSSVLYLHAHTKRAARQRRSSGDPRSQAVPRSREGQGRAPGADALAGEVGVIAVLVRVAAPAVAVAVVVVVVTPAATVVAAAAGRMIAAAMTSAAGRVAVAAAAAAPAAVTALVAAVAAVMVPVRVVFDVVIGAACACGQGKWGLSAALPRVSFEVTWHNGHH